MRLVPAMTDMRHTIEEKEEEYAVPSTATAPDYPYGLSISLGTDELEKLDLDTTDVCPGDMVHMHCMAVVTSVSKTDNQNIGPQCRIELQITHIAAESEEEEDEADEEQEDKPKNVTSKLYK